MREPRHERPVAALLIGVLATIWLATTATSADASVQMAETPARSYYLVSLDRASLADAAEAVLVQSLRSEAVVDPGLTGTVTFRVSEPLSDRELEERFALVLADQGVALVRADSGFRLMDLQDAQATRPRLDVVGVEAPPMKPGALTALTPAVLPKAPPTASNPTGRWILALSAVLAAAWLSVLAWLKRTSLRAVIDKSRAVRFRPSVSRADGRDAVVDHLLSKHHIDLTSLATACDQAAKDGRPVEQLLCDLHAVNEQQLADAYCIVTGLARWDGLASETLLAADLSAFFRQRPLKVIEADDWSITVATADPLDDRTFAVLSRLSGRMVTLQVAQRSDVSVESPAEPPMSPGLIIPWFRSPPPDGAMLLQAILSRRLSNQTEPAVPDHSR